MISQEWGAACWGTASGLRKTATLTPIDLVVTLQFLCDPAMLLRLESASASLEDLLTKRLLGPSRSILCSRSGERPENMGV